MAQPLTVDALQTARGTIVEFIGLPGSGKSTIAHALAETLRRRGATVSEPTWQNDHASSVPARTFRKGAFAIAAGIRDPERAGDLVQWIAHSRQPTIREAVKLTVNALYLAEARERCAHAPGIHVFDQGLLQQLWSVLYRAIEHHDAERTCAEQLTRCCGCVNVVIVETPLSTLRQRLQGRRADASRLERHLREWAPQAALQRAVFAQRRVEAVADALSSCGAIRLLRVSGGGDLTVPQAAAVVSDWLN